MAALTVMLRNLGRYSPIFSRTCTISSVRNINSEASSNEEPKTLRIPDDSPHPLWQYNKDKWVNALMLRDITRRRAHKKYATDRMRLLAMKRAKDILPREICDSVEEEFQERIPRTTAMYQLTWRCVLSSRSRHSNLQRWHLSRFKFRHMSDYNQIAGIQRAMW